MTTTVQQLLDSFDTLSPTEKYQATMEILRRFNDTIEDDWPEGILIGVADELFSTLDKEESDNAPQ